MKVAKLLILILAVNPVFSQDIEVKLKDVFSLTDSQIKPFLDEAVKNSKAFSVPEPVPYYETNKNSSETQDPYLYLPIFTKAIYEYEFTSSEFSGTKKVVVEYKDYSEKDSQASATIYFYNKKEVKTFDLNIKIKNNGLFVTGSILEGARTEIPIPLFKGKEWSENSNKNRVSSFSARIQTPAGNFENCLKIVTAIAGGDAGNAERYYAPNIGLIYEKISAEDKQELIRLVSYKKL